jgi:hypothetical protein
MVTRIADIIVPEIWQPYMIERTREKSLLFQSGIIEQNEVFDALARGGGSTMHMPFFADLQGSSEVRSDTTPLTPKKITSKQDISVKHYRGSAWGVNDLASALAGTDPADAIATLVAEFWNRDFQNCLIATLKGVFASALMASEHVINISIPAGNSATASNLISSNSTIDALKLMGDQLDAVTAIAVHGDIYHELLKQDVIEFEQPSEQGIVIQRYKGRVVIVDDKMPKVPAATNGFVYSTYLFGEGAIAYGEGAPKMPVESDRDVLQGDEYLVNNRDFIMHTRGVKWVGTSASTSPTNTELQSAAAYQRVYEKKNVRLLELKTNG